MNLHYKIQDQPLKTKRASNILQSMHTETGKATQIFKNQNHETYRINPAQEQPLYTEESNVFQTYANFTLPWEASIEINN